MSCILLCLAGPIDAQPLSGVFQIADAVAAEWCRFPSSSGTLAGAV